MSEQANPFSFWQTKDKGAVPISPGPQRKQPLQHKHSLSPTATRHPLIAKSVTTLPGRVRSADDNKDKDNRSHWARPSSASERSHPPAKPDISAELASRWKEKNTLSVKHNIGHQINSKTSPEPTPKFHSSLPKKLSLPEPRGTTQSFKGSTASSPSGKWSEKRGQSVLQKPTVPTRPAAYNWLGSLPELSSTPDDSELFRPVPISAKPTHNLSSSIADLARQFESPSSSSPPSSVTPPPKLSYPYSPSSSSSATIHSKSAGKPPLPSSSKPVTQHSKISTSSSLHTFPSRPPPKTPERAFSSSSMQFKKSEGKKNSIHQSGTTPGKSPAKSNTAPASEQAKPSTQQRSSFVSYLDGPPLDPKQIREQLEKVNISATHHLQIMSNLLFFSLSLSVLPDHTNAETSRGREGKLLTV